MKTSLVLAEIAAECEAGDAKYGEQNRVDHMGIESWDMFAVALYSMAHVSLKRGQVTWAALLAKEAGEAFMSENRTDLRSSLVKLAVIVVKWIEFLDRSSP